MKTEPHYTIHIENHQTAEWLQVELIDLPFAARTYEIRVNGKKPERTRYATKTQIWDRLRKWMVRQDGR